MSKLKKWIPTIIICIAIFALSSLKGTTINAVGLGKESYHVNGHFILYFLLGTSVYYAVQDGIKTFILAFIYAISDEFHQMFVPGRSWEFIDLLVDATGILLAIITLWKVYPIILNKLKKSPTE